MKTIGAMFPIARHPRGNVGPRGNGGPLSRHLHGIGGTCVIILSTEGDNFKKTGVFGWSGALRRWDGVYLVDSIFSFSYRCVN